MDAAKTAGEAVGENLGVHQQGHRRSTTASKKQRDRNPYGKPCELVGDQNGYGHSSLLEKPIRSGEDSSHHSL